MAKKIDGRALLIITAAICVCLASPLQLTGSAQAAIKQAANTGETAAGNPALSRKLTKHSIRYWKRYANRKSNKTATRSSERKTLDSLKTDDVTSSAALPAAIANANAQLVSADSAGASAAVMTTPANTPVQMAEARAEERQTPEAADSGLVSADQLNDVDRALTENKAPLPLLTMAAANSPIRISTPAISAEDSAWAKSSIIGKIFIFFGGLLTLASAARMFMA